MLKERGKMPAIYTDTLTLPRLPRATADTIEFKKVKGIFDSVSTLEGEGFPVRRPFPTRWLNFADPFLLLDQMGAVDYAPGEAKGTPWHPHRGFETVTYIMDGVMDHRDSHGGGGTITNGDTQWMTAGSGILHIEAPPEWLVVKGGLFHGVQLWVNLPASQKFAAPKYQDIRSNQLALISSDDGGSLIRVIAGSISGFEGPGMTQTPIIYAHATISPGARLELDWPGGHSAMVYSLLGSGTSGKERARTKEGQLALFGSGKSISIEADLSQPSYSPYGWEVLILGGVPINEPVARYGPFVMNTQDEIKAAFEDFQAGKMGSIPVDRIPHRSEADTPLED